MAAVGKGNAALISILYVSRHSAAYIIYSYPNVDGVSACTYIARRVWVWLQLAKQRGTPLFTVTVRVERIYLHACLGLKLVVVGCLRHGFDAHA